jgi:hypothetical protein
MIVRGLAVVEPLDWPALEGAFRFFALSPRQIGASDSRSRGRDPRTANDLRRAEALRGKAGEAITDLWVVSARDER